MKIKGYRRNPDYLQVRDDNFMLIAYFKADNLAHGFEKADMSKYLVEAENLVADMGFGQMKYIKNQD